MVFHSPTDRQFGTVDRENPELSREDMKLRMGLTSHKLCLIVQWKIFPSLRRGTNVQVALNPLEFICSTQHTAVQIRPRAETQVQSPRRLDARERHRGTANAHAGPREKTVIAK